MINPYACDHDGKFGRCPCDTKSETGWSLARAWDEGWRAARKYLIETGAITPMAGPDEPKLEYG